MPMVKLIDGTEVDNASEEWRFECECRYILNLPTPQARRDWLYGRMETNKFGRTGAVGGLLQRRGEEAVKKVEAKMLELWEARQKDLAG